MIIRKETEEDIETIYEIIESAFANQEFSNQEEVELVKNLRKTDLFIPELSLVAEEENKLIGQILFTKMEFEMDNRKEFILILAPVSVIPEYQNKGIGSKLIKKGHEIAKQLNYKGILVVGHEEYYPKFGYKSIANYEITCNMELPKEVTFLYEIEKDYFKNNKGQLIFSPAFIPDQ